MKFLLLSTLLFSLSAFAELEVKCHTEGVWRGHPTDVVVTISAEDELQGEANPITVTAQGNLLIVLHFLADVVPTEDGSLVLQVTEVDNELNPVLHPITGKITLNTDSTGAAVVETPQPRGMTFIQGTYALSKCEGF